MISALKAGEDRERAFGQLVENYKERLYWHIRGIVLNHDDADDVLQNTFIKVYKNIGGFKGDSSIYTWMYRIATNESLNHLKMVARNRNISLHEVKEEMINRLESDVHFNGGAIEIALQRAISTLPEKQQLVFNMKYFGNQTYEELSEILELSVGGLKSNYHHAVKKINAFLKEYDLNSTTSK